MRRAMLVLFLALTTSFGSGCVGLAFGIADEALALGFGAIDRAVDVVRPDVVVVEVEHLHVEGCDGACPCWIED